MSELGKMFERAVYHDVRDMVLEKWGKGILSAVRVGRLSRSMSKEGRFEGYFPPNRIPGFPKGGHMEVWAESTPIAKSRIWSLLLAISGKNEEEIRDARSEFYSIDIPDWKRD